MPNGFHGSKGEWERMEAPLLRIDPIIAAFARRHACQVLRNYRSAERSLQFRDALSRAIWIHTSDKYGADGKFQVSILAYEDRENRYTKAASVGDPVGDDDLDRMLERATAILMSWSAKDLEIAPAPRERKEMERVY